MAPIEKWTDAEILRIARLYFFGGLAFLPWLWLVNFIYVYPVTRKRTDLSPAISRYAWMSLVGSILWAFILTGWIVVYQTQRRSWGVLGDLLGINIPNGQ
ncbi:gamma-secretase aspartyl protease complex, presenilin enhancer-2 subunit [Cladochytrium replicatum]|nr:gamma-secretase aspartyl protease complex, presenilin enhancer-2 subunit [Cladochytrium replicatum]